MQFGTSMEGKWLPETLLPGFKDASLLFMKKCQSLSEKLMLCFARALGFPDDYFTKTHDITRPESQTVLRLLHYFPLDPSLPVPSNYHRAGAHVDWDSLTLLFQRPFQSGLEICPGREVSTAFGIGDVWTKVEPVEGEIVWNAGDLLMRWSDDRFRSAFHRVSTPEGEGDWWGGRFSMEFLISRVWIVRFGGRGGGIRWLLEGSLRGGRWRGILGR